LEVSLGSLRSSFVCFGFVVSLLSSATSSRGFSFLRGHARIGLRRDDGYCQDDEVCGCCGN
jgi:hypothetical protein